MEQSPQTFQPVKNAISNGVKKTKNFISNHRVYFTAIILTGVLCFAWYILTNPTLIADATHVNVFANNIVVYGTTGIGTDAPGAKLEISGGTRFSYTEEHDIYHMDIIPTLENGGNIRYEFRMTDYDGLQDKAAITIRGQDGSVGINSGNLTVSGAISATGGDISVSGPTYDFVNNRGAYFLAGANDCNHAIWNNYSIAQNTCYSASLTSDSEVIGYWAGLYFYPRQVGTGYASYFDSTGTLYLESYNGNKIRFDWAPDSANYSNIASTPNLHLDAKNAHAIYMNWEGGEGGGGTYFGNGAAGQVARIDLAGNVTAASFNSKTLSGTGLTCTTGAWSAEAHNNTQYSSCPGGYTISGVGSYIWDCYSQIPRYYNVHADTANNRCAASTWADGGCAKCQPICCKVH